MKEKLEMKYFLGISSKPLPCNENKAYWCINRKSLAQPGDIILIYIKNKGIAQIYKLSKVDNFNPQLSCEVRDMITVWLGFPLTLQEPLTSRYLKAHQILKNTEFVRKNFQGTTFSIEPNDYQVILSELRYINPSLAENIEFYELM